MGDPNDIGGVEEFVEAGPRPLLPKWVAWDVPLPPIPALTNAQRFISHEKELKEKQAELFLSNLLGEMVACWNFGAGWARLSYVKR